MKAYVVLSNKQIEPFGDHPRDCLITNRKLGDLQQETLQELGLDLRTIEDASQISDNNEYIILGDNLFFTKKVLQEFIERSHEIKANTICALKPGIVTLRSVVTTQDVQIHPDYVAYNLKYVPANNVTSETVPVIINADDLSEGVLMPLHMTGERKYLVPITEKLICQIDHWSNLWAANIASVLSVGAKVKNAPKLKLLSMALKARSTNQWRVLQQLNKIGKNCDIHPTAYIEGSTIGDGTVVAAGAIIRESVVGDGVNILNNVTIDCSVIGDQCFVGNSSRTQYSVLYPGTFFISKGISISMTGRDSFLGGGVTLTDFRFDGQNIIVMKDNNPIDTGCRLLGSCIGHRVYLAAGSVVSPGRTVPNDLRLAPKEMPIIRKFSTDGEVEGYQIIDQHTTN